MNKFFITFLALIFSFLNPAFSNSVFENKIIEKDNLVETTLQNKDIEKPYAHLEYNYESVKSIPIKISLKEKIKSEKDLYEGQTVEFIVQKSIYKNGKIKLKRGGIIKARVSTIISSGMNGIPASVIFDSFEAEDGADVFTPGQITDTLEVFGQDRTYYVFPLKWALTFLPPTGSLTNFIKGGHVRINTKKVFTLYYHPEWL